MPSCCAKYMMGYWAHDIYIRNGDNMLEMEKG